MRAIEIRTTGTKQTAEAMRLQAVDDAVKQGYILTRYFYNALVAFEKDPAGLRTAYADILDAIDMKQQQKAATEMQFASVTAPELVQLSRLEDRRMLVTAEKRLAAGDPKGAQELAQQALDKKIGDQGRALFILAQVAVANKNRDGARGQFPEGDPGDERSEGGGVVACVSGADSGYERRPRGGDERISGGADGGRGSAGGKAAAERGLQPAYEPPAKPQ